MSPGSGNPELSICGSDTDWPESANQRAPVPSPANERRGHPGHCVRVIMTHLAWDLSPAACPLSSNNKIFPNISCFNRNLTAGRSQPGNLRTRTKLCRTSNNIIEVCSSVHKKLDKMMNVEY